MGTYFHTQKNQNHHQRRGCSPDRRLSECLLCTSSVQRSQRDRETPQGGDLPGGDIFLFQFCLFSKSCVHLHVCSSVMQSHPFCTCIIWVEELVHDVWARSCQAVSMVGLPSVSNLDSCFCTLIIIFCVERLFKSSRRHDGQIAKG